MRHYKIYVRNLFIILAVILASAVSYAYYFSTHYPIPVTNRISFDAKIKFIREHIEVDRVDTIIVGSSIGLNNVRGEALEAFSKQCKHVLNLSVYESSPVQVGQALELIDVFPNLKRVIYSAQFTDFQHATSFKDYHPKWIKKYIAHQMSPVIEAKFLSDASKNIPFLINRKKEWQEKHGQKNKFTYLGFDHTGSVPLHIYGKDIIKARWKTPHGSAHPPRAMQALDALAKKLQNKHIRFYFVQQPYRQPLIKKYKHIPLELNWFLDKVTKIVSSHGGNVLSLYKELPLSDEYFADRSHLNDKGSVLGAKAIGRFIDKIEK